WPFRSLGASYPWIIEHAPWCWGAGFRATNTPARTAFVQRMAWPAQRATFEAVARAHRPDVIVTTHPLLAAPLRRVYPAVPIIAVVTDLVSGHVSWYDPAADLFVVPTRQARDAAMRCGIDREAIQQLGLPIAQTFVAVPGERAALQQRLGWATDRPTVLLAGGGDGLGPLEALAAAVDDAHLPCDIAVVAGRNAALATRLRARRWHGTVHVYDFVTNFPELLRAASALVTKAGPGTIAEACASGCPLILSGAIPGQETGNVDFVTSGRAGIWAPSPIATIAALEAWLVGRDAPAALARAARAARKLAQPDAAHDIARLVLHVAGAAHVGVTTDEVQPPAAPRTAAA
ncbi:MAG TPA: glycosyltransferase, partial [Gemmatimonadaceae bacterium]|nr:glycosyltransferase [Gemmatimonadaceae bacterium]